MSELDPEIAAMLRREGTRTSIPADAAARLEARVAASIGGGGGGGGDGGPGAGAGAGAGAGVKVLGVLAVAAGVAALVIVVARRSETPIAPLPASSASSVVARPAESVEIPAPSSTVVSVSVDSLPSAALPSAAGPRARLAVDAGAAGSSLSERADAADEGTSERTLLDTARRALASGDHAGALRALEEHRLSHANGRLAEEREALWVRTLAGNSRMPEARAAAERFRARWPGSVLLPAVESALAR